MIIGCVCGGVGEAAVVYGAIGLVTVLLAGIRRYLRRTPV